jgi:large repetitive protein
MFKTTLKILGSLIILTFIFGCDEGEAPQKRTSNKSGPGIPGVAKLVSPTLSSPSVQPLINNASSLVISGGCINDTTVSLKGDAVDSMICANSQFSFSVGGATDKAYLFLLTQKNTIDDESVPLEVRWIRDTQAPSAPSISAPSISPYISAGNTLTISGSCENESLVELSGSNSDSVVCSNSNYTFSVSQSSDGSYGYNLKQTDLAGNASATARQDWVRNSNVPPTPIISQPSTTLFYSSSGSLSISGSCTTGYTVNISGDMTGSTVCSASLFQFNVNKSSDGTYQFDISQADLTGYSSGATHLTWVKDTVAPPTPSVTSPGSSPVTNANNSINITGTCEPNASVSLSGATSASQACSSGLYSFTVSSSSDGTFTYTISQTDLAGNSSLGTVGVTWIRDTTAPNAPSITSPLSPYLSNSSTISIIGSCENNANLQVSGDHTASQTCSGGSFNISVSKNSDGTFNFSLKQTDIAGNQSAISQFQWTRDTTPPAAPSIVQPAINPYISSGDSLLLSGSCENNFVVSITGDSSNSVVCSAGAFEFNISKLIDGNYNFSITQKDLANNISAPATQQWQRLATSPVAPSISSPAINPYYSNSSSLTLIGTCISGHRVELSGSDTQNQICSSGSFSFSINAAVDGTYSYQVKQLNAANVTSASVTQQWIRDTQAPSSPTLTLPATNPYTSNESNLLVSGSCEAYSTVEVSGPHADSVVCSSGLFSFSIPKSADNSYKQTWPEISLHFQA